MKLSEKDIRFVMWTAVFSLLLMSVLHVFAPRAPSGVKYEENVAPVSEAESAKVLAELQSLNAASLKQLLSPNQTSATLLVIYTSWCPHCRQALPDVINLQQKGFLKNARVLFISVDEQPKKLAAYLSQPDLRDQFIPYIIDHRERQSIGSIFSFYGLNFNGAIPYAALLNKEGALIADTSSGNWDKLLQSIKELSDVP